MMKWTKGKVFGVLWAILGASFFIWIFVSMNAKGFGEEIFATSALVSVDRTDDFTSFTPTKPYQKVVFFYPGALVDPDAYAPLCRMIAENGHRVLLVHMPWRLAIKGYTKIKDLDLLADTTRQHILAGHSQGGKMAAQFVYENPNGIDKLILLGTTHPKDIDLSTFRIPVLKIYGSDDGIAESSKVITNKPKLPSTARYVRISGANHSQFGYYGFQLGDKKAEITRQKQQKLVLKHILDFISQPVDANVK